MVLCQQYNRVMLDDDMQETMRYSYMIYRSIVVVMMIEIFHHL